MMSKFSMVIAAVAMAFSAEPVAACTSELMMPSLGIFRMTPPCQQQSCCALSCCALATLDEFYAMFANSPVENQKQELANCKQQQDFEDLALRHYTAYMSTQSTGCLFFPFCCRDAKADNFPAISRETYVNRLRWRKMELEQELPAGSMYNAWTSGLRGGAVMGMSTTTMWAICGAFLFLAVLAFVFAFIGKKNNTDSCDIEEAAEEEEPLRQ